MFCTYAGTRKDKLFRSGESPGISPNNKKPKSCPESDSIFVFYFLLEKL